MEKVPGHGLCPDLSGPGRPARSMHIPDRRQILGKTSISRHFLFGIAHWSILLRGIAGHGEDLDENGCFTSRTCVLRLDRYGSSGYFFFEKHSLIDFQIGKGRKRDFPRGRAAIFSTQRILRGRDRDLLQNVENLFGAMLPKW